MECVLKRKPRKTLLFGIFVAALIAGGCKSPTSPDVPEGHTVSKNGTYHKPGLENPTVNCVGCHGADLRGGSAGVSCFKCHGQKW